MVDFSHIPNVPTLPAVLRETPDVTPQVTAELQALSVQAQSKVAQDAALRAIAGGEHDFVGRAQIMSVGGNIESGLLTRIAKSFSPPRTPESRGRSV